MHYMSEEPEELENSKEIFIFCHAQLGIVAYDRVHRQ